MAAYIIVEVKIQDKETYEEYKKLTPASMAPFGGKFIVRGGSTETLEGDWQPERVVILEFPSIEKAKELGCSTFDFEGSMLKGVEKFFRGFGPELVPSARRPPPPA